MNQMVEHLIGLLNKIPREINPESLLWGMIFYIGFVLFFGVIGRACMGKRSSLNIALSTVMAVLFVYVMTSAIYTFRPWNLDHYLSPLPFVAFTADHLFLLPILECPLPLLCGEVLSLFILCFLVNFLDSVIPQGEGPGQWVLYRLLTVVLSMALYVVVNWALRSYLPESIMESAPIILLGILLLMLFLSVLNLVLGLALAAANPFIGALYAFFFKNVVGKQLTKSVLSTVLLCVLFFMLAHYGFFSININEAHLIGYLPYLGCVGLLWFLLGRLL